jgi:arginine decarboxylase
VLHSRQLGIDALVVMEQYSELDTLLSVAAETGVRPAIGVRAKLTTQHKGHWGSTSGARALFWGRGLLLAVCVGGGRDSLLARSLTLLRFLAALLFGALPLQTS